MSNISALISSQISERLHNSAPLYVAFMELYYKYAQLRKNSIGIIQNNKLDVDIDQTLDEYVDKFYSVYGSELPKTTSLDRRIIIKLLSDIYVSKGTEKSFKLLFRVLFGVEIDVYYPSENILRASGGVWNYESFITLEKVYGEVNNENLLSFSNESGDFLINSFRTDTISDTRIRFYFRSYTTIKFEENQLVYIKSDTGVIQYIGKLVKSPAHLTIDVPGADWQVGQIITIPGTIKNTIARITKINSTSGIEKCEILDYGFDHYENQTTIVSPYSNRPIESFVNIEKIVLDNSTNYILTINDYIDGIKETTNGTVSGINIEDKTSNYAIEYFAENYNDKKQSIDIFLSSSNEDKTDAYGYSDINIDIWLSSRAWISIDNQNLVNTRGSYSSDLGLLSNKNSVLQDNYYYQLFSYQIQSPIDISDFKSILKVAHPAGTKLFYDLSKIIHYDLGITSSRSHNIQRLRLNDESRVVDSEVQNHFLKVIENSMGENDGIDDEWGAPEFFDDDYEEMTENLTEIVDKLY